MNFRTQLLDIRVQRVEALGNLIVRAFEPGHPDIQGINGHQTTSTFILSRRSKAKRIKNNDRTC
jgi:hypothetical protein